MGFIIKTTIWENMSCLAFFSASKKQIQVNPEALCRKRMILFFRQEWIMALQTTPMRTNYPQQQQGMAIKAVLRNNGG